MERKNALTFIDVISEIESASIPLDESINILFLFGELLWDASHWLDPAKPYTIEVFNSRLDLLMSMHSTILRELGNANRALRDHITSGYRLHAEQKANAAAK